MTVSVFDFIPVAEHAAIIARTSTYDATSDLGAAIADVKSRGETLYFPGGTYLVSTVTFDGADYAVDTSAGVTFQQLQNLAGDIPIISIGGASRLTIGDLNLVGNIATDAGENRHGVLLARCKDVTIGRIFATDVRGDALYCYARNTSVAERQSGCFVESVSGTNVYRNLLTVAGGEIRVGAVIHAGPVGYRDFDVEPNDASGTYEAVDLQIGYARVGSAEITSDDHATINHAVRIGILDADFDRVQATTPPYPKAPGGGAYALGISRVDSVRIGQFRARNYNWWVVNLSVDWGSLDIGTFDVAHCALVDTPYNSMIVQRGNAQGGSVRIGTLICDATNTRIGDAANTRFLARVQDAGLLKIEVSNIRLMKCMAGNQLTGRFANGIIDLDGGNGTALIDSTDVIFDNIETVNAGSATGFYQCANIAAINSTLTFGTLDGGGSGTSDFVAINSSINGSARDGINLVLGGAVRVANIKVLGEQQPAIATPSSGTPIDSEARAAISSMLTALRNHGIIAA